MNRRTLITAAPAVALAAAITIPATAKAEGVTTDIWERWRDADAIADRDLKDESAAEKRMLAREIAYEEFEAIEGAASVTWKTAFDLGYEAYITPAVTAADVVGKARVVAWAVDLDDWGARIDGDLVVCMLRDLAAAHGVSHEVAAIIDPVIAARDALREKRAALDAAKAALPARPALSHADPDAELHRMIVDYQVMADLNCEADPHSAEICKQHALIERIAETSPSTVRGAVAKLRLGFDDDHLRGFDESGPLDRVSAASVRDVLRLLDGRA